MLDKTDHKRLLRWLGIVLFSAVLTACTCFVVINGIWVWLQNRPIPPPTELLSGTEKFQDTSSYRVIYERDGLQRFAQIEDNLKLVIVEVMLEGQSLERRAYLEVNRSESIYLGSLHPIPNQAPVEFLFFQVNEARMAATWVDPNLTTVLHAVSIVRTEQLGDMQNDNDLARLSDGPARGQSAFISLRDSDRWLELKEIRVSSGDSTGYRYVEELSPPYPLTQEFEQHSIVWP